MRILNPLDKITSRKVRIKDTLKEDAGKGRVRIDPDLNKELGLRNGDIIEIRAK